MTKRFYVYTLTDPRNGEIFYVGKGSGRRIQAHEDEARKGAYSRKCNRIRSIWADGEQVVRQMVSHHEDENEALAAEQAMIDLIGLENLTNVVPGGTIGAEAYLARKAEEEARRSEKHASALSAKFEEMAPKFARMFHSVRQTGGFGFLIKGEWREMSGDLTKVFWEVVDAVGFDRASAVMRGYGVELKGAPHGSAQS